MKFSGFNTSEKVGIGFAGTSLPDQTLVVKASLPVVALESSNNQSRIDFRDGSTIQATIGLNPTHGDSFNIALGGSLTSDVKLLVKPDGNVGIGTNAPANIVDVRGSGTPTLAVRNTGTSTNATLHLGEVNQTAYGVELRYEGNLGNLFLDNRYNHATRPHMYFRMRVAGTPIVAMTIDPAGNVGIGSASPTSLLTISGNSDDGDGACALRIIDEDSTGGSKLPAIMFYGGSTMQGRIRGGDGTFAIAVGSTPTTALSIDTSTRKLTLGSYGSGTHTGTSAYKLSVDSSGNVIETSIGAGAVDGSGTTNYISKWTDGDTIGNSLIYDDGTNDVGIGVVPTAVNTSHKSLQLGGNVNIQSYGTKGAGGEVDFCHNVYLNQDGNYKLISADEATMYRQGGGKHMFYSWASGSAGSTVSVNAAATKLAIMQNGDVGIGTATPSQQLMVWEGSSSVSFGEYTNGAVIWLDGVNGDLSGGDYFHILADGSNALRFGYAAVAKVSMKNNGSVGIGTTDPVALLDVAGSTGATTTIRLLVLAA